MQLTLEQYNTAISKCKDIFEKKTKDYGTAWRILRTSSLTDQIFIKANRIRTIQETGKFPHVLHTPGNEARSFHIRNICD